MPSPCAARIAQSTLGPIENMERLFNHLIQRHLVPVLLLPVVFSGLGCFAVFLLPEVFRSSSTPDRVLAVVFSLIGIFGTIATFILLRVIHRQASSWRVFDLGRTAWTILVSLAWLVGVGCGCIMMYELSGLSA